MKTAKIKEMVLFVGKVVILPFTARASAPKQSPPSEAFKTPHDPRRSPNYTWLTTWRSKINRHPPGCFYQLIWSAFYLGLSEQEGGRVDRGHSPMEGAHIPVLAHGQIASRGDVAQPHRLTPADKTLRPPGIHREQSSDFQCWRFFRQPWCDDEHVTRGRTWYCCHSSRKAQK